MMEKEPQPSQLVDELGQRMTPTEILGLMRFVRTGDGPIVTEFESALRQLPEAYPVQAGQLVDLLNRSGDEQDQGAVGRYFSPSDRDS